MSETMTRPTLWSQIRLVIGGLAILFGGLGSVAGVAIIFYVIVFGQTEGDAMFGGAGMVLLVVGLPLLALGWLICRGRRITDHTEEEHPTAPTPEASSIETPCKTWKCNCGELNIAMALECRKCWRPKPGG